MIDKNGCIYNPQRELNKKIDICIDKLNNPFFVSCDNYLLLKQLEKCIEYLNKIILIKNEQQNKKIEECFQNHIQSRNKSNLPEFMLDLFFCKTKEQYMQLSCPLMYRNSHSKHEENLIIRLEKIKSVCQQEFVKEIYLTLDDSLLINNILNRSKHELR